jgi:dissimilatory sulfite reductase (desulfoviridin) alpha/beta subunit
MGLFCQEKNSERRILPTDRGVEERGTAAPVDRIVEDITTPLDLTALKAGGIIQQRQKHQFTVRLKCPGGRVPLERLAKIVEVAKKYAGDYVHVSVRQSIELPCVDFENVERVRAELAKVGQEIASAGPRVRVPTACAGCEYNVKGLTPTQKMAAEVCERFFGKRSLPHKFKITFSGCPNDCMRTNESDLGFQGAVRPRLSLEACIGCGLCERACLEGAIACDADSGRPIHHPDQCVHCGDCIRACPASAWTADATGWIVRCGGKHGRHPITGSVIARFVPDARIAAIIEAVLAWYEANGCDKGRIRLATLLLDEKVWREFLEAIGPALGEWAVADPPPPRSSEPHFTIFDLRSEILDCGLRNGRRQDSGTKAEGQVAGFQLLDSLH